MHFCITLGSRMQLLGNLSPSAHSWRWWRSLAAKFPAMPSSKTSPAFLALLVENHLQPGPWVTPPVSALPCLCLASLWVTSSSTLSSSGWRREEREGGKGARSRGLCLFGRLGDLWSSQNLLSGAAGAVTLGSSLGWEDGGWWEEEEECGVARVEEEGDKFSEPSVGSGEQSFGPYCSRTGAGRAVRRG